MNTATELESFRNILDFSQNQKDNPTALIAMTTDLVSAIEWGLFDGPERVDRSHLPLVSAGVMQMIQDIGDIAQPSGEEPPSPESEYALYKICDWRAQSRGIISSWLSGWWVHDDDDNDDGAYEDFDEGDSEPRKPSLTDEFGDGLRVLQFAGSWLWRFYISPTGNHLRRQCSSVEIIAPPLPVVVPVQPPPGEPIDDIQSQQPCESVDELAAFLGVKFGEPCPNEVMQAYHTRLEYAPLDTDTRGDLARCFARQKNYPEAVREYEAVLQDKPELHEARKELIVCLAFLRQWDAADAEARYLSGFTRMRPDGQQALICLQSLRYQTQD